MVELEVGSRFAGHRLDGVAGRGGMGVVYIATDLELDRRVALKLIAPEYASDVAFRERFKRESRLAASISHPHVITIHRAGEDQGLLFITMEYVEGSDLRELIASSGRLDPPTAAAIVAQVGSALDAAHERGLVHRDIKPANVLIAGSNGSRHAYLTDFGLVKRADSQSSMTGAGTFVGTLDYAAPEQLQGQPVDARTDVYALGCLLYHVLSGSVPYPRDTDAAKMFAHIGQPPPVLAEDAPHVPAQFQGVIERAMAKDPADRYPSAGDLARAVLEAAGGPVTAQPEASVATGEAAPSTRARGLAAAPTASGQAPPTAAAGSPAGSVAESVTGSQASEARRVRWPCAIGWAVARGLRWRLLRSAWSPCCWPSSCWAVVTTTVRGRSRSPSTRRR